MVQRPPTLSADKSTILSVISTKRRKFWAWLIYFYYFLIYHTTILKSQMVRKQDEN